MKTLKLSLRMCHICFVLAKYRLDKILVSFSVFSAFRFISLLNPLNYYRRKQLSNGEALSLALEELGPIFVKFGQALSTRKDLLSKEYTDPLSRLQDDVQPFASSQIYKILERAYGKTVDQVFASFEEMPLASASMAQVHAATLAKGQSVVVKVLRPNLHQLIERDINIMRKLAELLTRYWKESRRLKPLEIVEEFATTLFDELDLLREAGNASQLRRNFKHSELLYVPEIYWDYVRDNVVVMERIHGVAISDIPGLKAAGIDIKTLAERGIEIFFTQVFRHCFFHADMHPGNVFVDVKRKKNPRYIAIDFGIMGTLTENDKRYLAENLIAFFNRDYRRVALLHIESGWVPANTRSDAFESAIRTVCEPIFEKPLKDISFGQVILRLFQTGRRFNMQVQPQLVLLQKTLLSVEGLGRQLYPELNLWSTAKPFLEKWVKEQMGPKTFWRNTKENLPFVSEQLPHLPRLVFDVLSQQKALTRQQLLTTPPPSKRLFKRGLGVGMLAVPLVMLLANQPYHAHARDIIAFGVSLLGVVLLLLG